MTSAPFAKNVASHLHSLTTTPLPPKFPILLKLSINRNSERKKREKQLYIKLLLYNLLDYNVYNFHLFNCVLSPPHPLPDKFLDPRLIYKRKVTDAYRL